MCYHNHVNETDPKGGTIMKNKQDVMQSYVGFACGAPRHHHKFTTTRHIANGIMEMFKYGRRYGLKALLQREYPDGCGKNVIVNVIGGKTYLVDGNTHAVALVSVKPDLTFGELEALHPGLVRVWFAGVEEGANGPENPCDVYIPAEIDASRIPEAYLGTDYFKDPPAPTYIVPAVFPADSDRLNKTDRGYLLCQTALAILAHYAD